MRTGVIEGFRTGTVDHAGEVFPAGGKGRYIADIAGSEMQRNGMKRYVASMLVADETQGRV